MRAGTYVTGHPDDVNTADAKALCAEYDATYVGNPYVPRGQVFVMRMPDGFGADDA